MTKFCVAGDIIALLPRIFVPAPEWYPYRKFRRTCNDKFVFDCPHDPFYHPCRLLQMRFPGSPDLVDTFFFMGRDIFQNIREPTEIEMGKPN